MSCQSRPPSLWAKHRAEKHRRFARVASIADGVVLPTERIVHVLQALIAPGDRAVVEGNNQKQLDFLSRSLAKVDPERVHDLRLIIPAVSRAHSTTSRRSIARNCRAASQRAPGRVGYSTPKIMGAMAMTPH